MSDNHMCDEEKFHALETRVDSVENRLTKVETSLSDMRSECQRGFASIEKNVDRIYDQNKHLYEEKARWGSWARDNLGRAFYWIGIIVLAACGITQATSIIKLFIK